MKYFVSSLLLILVVTASGSADNTGYYYPIPASLNLLSGGFSTSIASPVQQQYHRQDAFGQYAYGYSDPLSSKHEFRNLDGVTRGSYSYRDADGKVQTVDYIADADGFRVAATNLPLAAPGGYVGSPVAETPEVAAARAEHLAAYREVEKRLLAATLKREQSQYAALTKSASATPSPTSPQQLPSVPVGDTPEVAAAKAAFFRRYEQEQQHHQLLKKQQKIGASLAVLRAAQPFVTTAAAPIALSYQPVLLRTPHTALRLANQLVAAVPAHAYLPAH